MSPVTFAWGVESPFWMVGETVTVNGIQFQIIGLLETKTQISNYNTPDNECIFIPLSTSSVLNRR